MRHVRPFDTAAASARAADTRAAIAADRENTSMNVRKKGHVDSEIVIESRVDPKVKRASKK